MPPTNSSVVIVVAGEDKTGQVFDQINQHLRQTTDEVRHAEGAMSQFGEMVKRRLEYLGIYFGAREAIDLFKKPIEESIEFAETLEHLNEQTGISTRNLASLKVMADQTGIDFDVVVKGFKKLSTSLMEYQENDRQVVDSMGMLGISQKDLAATGGDLWKVMELVADKMHAMPDGWRKSAAAVELFGRAGQQMIPVLDEGGPALRAYADEAQRLGLVMSRETIAKLEEAHAKLAALQEVALGASVSFTSALAPALAGIASSLTDSADQMAAWTKIGAEAGEVAAWLSEAFGAFSYDLKMAGNELSNLTGAFFSIMDWTPGKKNSDYLYDQKEMAWTADREKQLQKSHDDFVNKMEKLRADLGKPIAVSPEVSVSGSNAIGAPTGRARGRGGRAGAAEDPESRRIDEGARRELEAMERADQQKFRADEDGYRQSEDLARSHASVQEAILESQYAGMASRDQVYYDRKRQIEKAEYDSEETSLSKQIARVQAEKSTVEGKQRETELDAQILQLQTQLAELADRRKIGEAEITGEMARQAAEAQRAAAEKQKEADRQLGEQQKQAERNGERYADAFFDPLLSGTRSWAQSMKQALDDITKEWAKNELNRAVVGMFGGHKGSPGSPGSDMLPSGKQHGGFLGRVEGIFGLSKGVGGGSMPQVPSAAGGVTPASMPGMRLGNSPNISVQIVNNGTPQQVTDVQGGQGKDPSQFVISTVLDDLNRGGSTAQAITGLAKAALLV